MNKTLKNIVILILCGGFVAFAAPSMPAASKSPAPIERRNRGKARKPHRPVTIGTRITRLPATHVSVVFNGLTYLYAAGVYYAKVSETEYEVVKPQKGMVVPQLPEYNVGKVEVNGETLFLFEQTLYKQIPTTDGLQYQVVGYFEM